MYSSRRCGRSARSNGRLVGRQRPSGSRHGSSGWPPPSPALPPGPVDLLEQGLGRVDVRVARAGRRGSPGRPRRAGAPSAGPACRGPARRPRRASSRGAGSGASSRGSRAYFATLPSSCATMLRHFWGPIPGKPAQEALVLPDDRVGDVGDRRDQRPRGDQRPDVLDGDEPLEELALQVPGESDQHGAGLVARGVVVDDQLELGPVGPVARGEAVEPAGRRPGAARPRTPRPPTRRSRGLPAGGAAGRGARRSSAAERRAPGTGRCRRARARRRRGSAAAGAARARRACMARATCAFGAAPEAVTARLTSAGASETSTTRWPPAGEADGGPRVPHQDGGARDRRAR